MRDEKRHFTPAAGHDWLLGLYDPLVKLIGADSARRDLALQASLQANQRVLDIGCGTGSLIVLLATLQPGLDLVGLDPDPKALARAARKLERAGHAARLERGFSDELPYADASFDRVFSSFMLHHLSPDEKAKTLSEARRVLRPGGSLHLLDFGGAGPNRAGLLAHLLHATEQVQGNFEGGIAALLQQAGFAEAREVAQRTTLFGRIAYFSAPVPAGSARSSGAGARH